MTAEPILPPPQDGWTHFELDHLPDEFAHRAELIDGSLVVSPSPSAWHNNAMAEIRNALVEAAPDGFWAYFDTEIRKVDGDGLIRQRPIPDVIVGPRALGRSGAERGYAVPEEVGLVVEVVSPSTIRTDRLVKPGWYAELGIPALWRVEPDISLVEYHLRPDGMFAIVRTAVGGVFRTEVPYPVSIDLERLR